MNQALLRSMLVAISLTVAATACSSNSPVTAPQTPAPATGQPHVVFYAEGEGTTTGAVTLVTETGGTIQKDVHLPAGDETTGKPGIASDAFKRGAHLYMSLQNSEAAGKVTCRIEVNGKKIDEASSEGPYKVAACRGTVP